jgi:AcrR family transcriptional regulator
MIQSESPIPSQASEVNQEPFACPHCGQMLAASCRVCVACQQAVAPSEIAAPPSLPTPSEALEAGAATPPERVRFPWRIFLLVLAVWMASASAVQFLMTPLKSQLVLAGVQVLTAVWVFYDAQSRGLPKALRWGLGTLLLWPIIFPWYLGRRSKPAARCPFVEGPAGPLTRALLVILLLVLFILALKGPAGK